MKNRLALTAAALAVTGSLAACGGGGNPLSSKTAAPGGGSASAGSAAGAPSGQAASGTVRVGAANFPESQLLADVYAAALNAKGVKATTGDPIGAREVYLKALQQGSIDLVPEYIFSLLDFYDKSANEKAPDKIYAALKTKIPSSEVLLNYAKAEDANSITVTQQTAKKWNLKSIGDLAKHSSQVTLGAPPEFQGRQQGLKGLKSVYGFTPKFRALSGTTLANYLKNGQIQAANIFTTDPSIAQDHFVVLKDPKHLFGSDAVVPLMRKQAATPKVTKILNAVQAKLTTKNLGEMDKQMQVDHQDPKKIAQQFLKQNGLG